MLGRIRYDPPGAPLSVARYIYEHSPGLHGRLLHWHGQFWLHHGTHYRPWRDEEIHDVVRLLLEHAVFENKKGEDEPWNPTPAKVNNIVKMMETLVRLEFDTRAPSWVTDDPYGLRPGAAQVLSCQNGLVDLQTRTPWPHTPTLFNFVHVPFSHDPDAREPVNWLRSLAQWWPHSPESIETLQEWFGYCLSGRMEQQKMLWIKGAGRSGKGTIAEGVLKKLMGPDAVTNPTMMTLGNPFGLQPLIGVPLAIVSDAVGTASQPIVEHLKTVSGEGGVTVNVKGRNMEQCLLPTRFMFLSNESPKFRDASGVISTRFLFLEMTQSWYNKEDFGLADKLQDELPAILNWALDGLDRLNKNGRFTATKDKDQDPVYAFLRDRCVVGPQEQVTRAQLYAAWVDYGQTGSPHVFGRLLHSACAVQDRQRRVKGERVWCYVGVGLKREYSGLL